MLHKYVVQALNFLVIILLPTPGPHCCIYKYNTVLYMIDQGLKTVTARNKVKDSDKPI